MRNIEHNCSLDSELIFISICSIRIRALSSRKKANWKFYIIQIEKTRPKEDEVATARKAGTKNKRIAQSYLKHKERLEKQQEQIGKFSERYLRITHFLEGIQMGHIKIIYSWISELETSSICSIGTLARNWVIRKKLRHNFYSVFCWYFVF